MAKKKFINQLYRKNKSSMVTSKMLQEQSVNAILADSENRTLWINGSPYGNAYVKPDTNNEYDRLDPSNKDTYGPIHAEIFNDFDNNTAEGDYSHAEGLNTRTKNLGEHAEGKYNYSVEGSTISTIGIGTSDDKRKNAMRVDNDGSVYLSEIKQQLTDGRRITHDPCNYDGTEKKEDTRSLQEILAGLGNMINVTYGELRTLIDNKKLIPGMQYRITDYGSTGNNYIDEYSNTNYQFAGNQFDIIVVADDIDTLNVEGRACEHDFDNDIKILVENIINNEKDTINNKLTEEQKNDPTFFVSYENFKIYSETQNDVIKNSYYALTKNLYNKILNQTSEIDKKKKYFTDYHTDFSKWKLKYDINNNNIYNWVNKRYDDKYILVNVSIDDGNNGKKYEIREYHFDSNIDYTPGDSDITYKYKWRLIRYQTVNNQSVTNFIENDDENPINLTSFIDNNVLLTELKYPSNDYTGSLLFCKDSSLYKLYIDNETSKKDYLMEDILLVNIYNNTKSEDTYFLYSGTIFYDNKLVHKWVESTSNTYEKFITGTPNIVNNNYLSENWNTQIRKDSNGSYYRYILSETLTPFSIDDEDENKQKYITNDSTQTPSFIEDSYFKEYIVTPKIINKNGMYIVGICDQSNEKLAFDGMTIFKKEDKNSNEYKIHYNLTEEIYSYTQNNITKYYNVWYINNISDTNDIVPNRILTGGYDSDKRALEYIEKLKSTEINDLDKLQSLKDELYNNITWYETLLSDGNTNVFSEKFYEYSTTYEIKTTVFNTIKFNFVNKKELTNIKQVINNESYDSNSLTENIPDNKSDYKLFNFYYDTYKTNNYQGINLNIYKNNNNDNIENFVIGVDENNNVFIYYDYIQDDKIIQDEITKEYYNYFNFVDYKYFAQGVITYLCDEFNNECGYDFKNIKFYHQIEYGDNLYTNSGVGKSIQYNESNKKDIPESLKYFYTFSKIEKDYTDNKINIFDSTINNYNIYNNTLNSNLEIKYSINKNIFINCYFLNENNFHNVYNIIFANSALYYNNFENISYCETYFYINTDGYVDAYYGNAYIEKNCFKNIYDISFKNVTGLYVGSFDIYTNNIYNYNNIIIENSLTSSILCNKNTYDDTKLSNDANTKLDITNIKTKRGKKLIINERENNNDYNENVELFSDKLLIDNINNIDTTSTYIKHNVSNKFSDLNIYINNSGSDNNTPTIDPNYNYNLKTLFTEKNYYGYNSLSDKHFLIDFNTYGVLNQAKNSLGSYTFELSYNSPHNSPTTENFNTTTNKFLNKFSGFGETETNKFYLQPLTILDFDLTPGSKKYQEINNQLNSKDLKLTGLYFKELTGVLDFFAEYFKLDKEKNYELESYTSSSFLQTKNTFVDLFPGLFLDAEFNFENFYSNMPLNYFLNLEYKIITEININNATITKEYTIEDYQNTGYGDTGKKLYNENNNINGLTEFIDEKNIAYSKNNKFYVCMFYSPFRNGFMFNKNIEGIRKYFKNICETLIENQNNKINKIKTYIEIDFNKTGFYYFLYYFNQKQLNYVNINNLYYIPSKFLNIKNYKNVTTDNYDQYEKDFLRYAGSEKFLQSAYLSYNNYFFGYCYGEKNKYLRNVNLYFYDDDYNQPYFLNFPDKGYLDIRCGINEIFRNVLHPGIHKLLLNEMDKTKGYYPDTRSEYGYYLPLNEVLKNVISFSNSDSSFNRQYWGDKNGNTKYNVFPYDSYFNISNDIEITFEYIVESKNKKDTAYNSNVYICNDSINIVKYFDDTQNGTKTQYISFGFDESKSDSTQESYSPIIKFNVWKQDSGNIKEKKYKIDLTKFIDKTNIQDIISEEE